MWGWQGWCGDDGDDGDMWRPQTMETTWGPSGGYGDNMRMMGMMATMWGWLGQHVETTDHGDYMGTSGGYGDNMRMTGMMGTMWGQCGDDRDDVGTTGIMRGWQGPRGDNKITKNAITFEWIEIIEFRLKIWDTWALPHPCRLQLMCRWGGVLSQMSFLSKKCSGDPRKIFFLFLHWIPLDHI